MAKTALITGASSGIGRECARILSEKGFKVILAARREDRLRALAEELPGESRIEVCDLSDREACFALHERLLEERVTVLINNAGFGKLGQFKDIPLEDELRMIDTNVTAVHILTKLYLKEMIEEDRGYILNVASSAGLMPGGPLMSTYYATKAYVTSLTSGVNEELQRTGSRVSITALCPGPVDTEFNQVADAQFGVKAITPRFCAEAGINGMFSRKLIVVPEPTLRIGTALSKLAPRRLALSIAGDLQSGKKPDQK